MPMDEAQWFFETDTRKVVAPPQPEPGEIGPVAQAFGTTSEPARNVTPGRSGNENTTVSALKALAEQVKSLESKLAAQDARIALLERSLDDLQRRGNR
jgi:hypothetical protein